MLTELTPNTTSLYIALKCLKTRLTSGTSPRQSVAFFTPHGFTSMGAVEQKHKTRKGNTARSSGYGFSTLAPTNSLENEMVDLLIVSTRSKAMTISSLRERDARTVARAIRILEKSFNGERSAQISSPNSAKQYLRLKLSSLEHEEFHAVWLDPNNSIIAIEPLFRGTLAYCQVHPREVIKSAIKQNAARVIFAHNHPSGKSTPSAADISLTKELKKALSIIEVDVIDHIIIAGSDISSLVEMGEF